jgi:hypothetical protein
MSTAHDSADPNNVKLLRFLPYVYLLILSSSLLGNVYQACRLRIQSNTRSPAQTHLIEKQVGQKLLSFNVMTLAGKKEKLPFAGPSNTIVYIFDPHCYWCARNLPNLLSLVSQRESTYHFVGISRTSHDLQDYLSVHPLPFPVYVDSSEEDFKRLDFLGTPQTLIVLPDGTVKHNWPGAYDGSTRQALQEYLQVDLPGLLPS